LVLEPGLEGVGKAADHESSELLKDPPLPGVASILGDGDLKYIVEYEPSFKLCCTDLGVNKGIFNAPVLSHTAVLDSIDQRFKTASTNNNYSYVKPYSLDLMVQTYEPAGRTTAPVPPQPTSRLVAFVGITCCVFPSE